MKMAANLEEIRQDMRGLQHFRLSSMFIKQIEPESSFKPVKKALVKVGGILTNVIKFKSGNYLITSLVVDIFLNFVCRNLVF